MRILKQAHNRLILLLIFALACIRVVARVLPVGRTARAANRDALRKGIQRGLLVRALGSSEQPYALQATGSFPYVKVVPAVARAQAVPVPVEIAGLAPKAARAAKAAKPSAHALTRKEQKAAVKPFCIPVEDCTDCTDCGGCTDCTSCTDCVCSCTSCASCSDCTPTTTDL